MKNAQHPLADNTAQELMESVDFAKISGILSHEFSEDYLIQLRLLMMLAQHKAHQAPIFEKLCILIQTCLSSRSHCNLNKEDAEQLIKLHSSWQETLLDLPFSQATKFVLNTASTNASC